MTVGVAARQRVFAARERIEILVEDEALRQIAVAWVAGALPGQELVFRHGVGLVSTWRVKSSPAMMDAS